MNTLEQFIENHGDDFLRWQDGCIVVESLFDKQFRALGGDTDRLIALFEDYGNMNDATRRYLAALQELNDRKT